MSESSMAQESRQLIVRPQKNSLLIDVLPIVLGIILLKAPIFSWSMVLKMVLASMMIVAFYSMRYIVRKKDTYKMLAYFSFHLVLISLCLLLKMPHLLRYAPFISTLLALVTENYQMEGCVKNYLIGSFCASFLTCGLSSAASSFVMTLLISFVFFMFMKERKTKRRVYPNSFTSISQWTILCPKYGHYGSEMLCSNCVYNHWYFDSLFDDW